MKFKNIRKKTKSTKYPSNSRSIPDFAKASPGKAEIFKFALPKIDPKKLLKMYRIILKVLVVFAFIAAVLAVGLDLQKNLQAKQRIDSQRKTLTKNLSFWENFLSKHQNFPDAYFQASMLEYKLGDTSKAKMYNEKGLALNPNSENGRRLEHLLR